MTIFWKPNWQATVKHAYKGNIPGNKSICNTNSLPWPSMRAPAWREKRLNEGVPHCKLCEKTLEKHKNQA